MAEEPLPFDMAGYLSSDEAIAECLTQVLADGDCDELLEQKRLSLRNFLMMEAATNKPWR